MLVDANERRKTEPLVVKIGGSLLSGPRLSGVAAILARARRTIVIVPGGGVFADQVRSAQAIHCVSDRAAHEMAMLAMHQMGLLLVDMQPRFIAVETLSAIRQAIAVNRIPVWLPLKVSAADEAIAADWSVTSDALAARLAERLRFDAVLLVKSRCVPRGPTAEELAAAGIVDSAFGEIVKRADLAFRIIGPGEERPLAEICLATPLPAPAKVRRLSGHSDRARRGARRVMGLAGNNPRH